LGLLLCVLALAGPAAAADIPTGAGAISVAGEHALSDRLTEYTLNTPALAAPTNVRVLLPADYAANPTRRYPVLYLLHGCCDADVDGSQAWTTHGEAEKSTAGLDLIVVMPAGGKGGFYTDWYNDGNGGAPAYETYHIKQLIPWVDKTFRTRAARSGRAIAGLSMGGFGAMSYAARHPDLFVSASAFSGAVDIEDEAVGEEVDALGLLDGGTPTTIFGNKYDQEIRWRAHNPVDLAGNLRGLNLTLRTGNGLPGGAYGGGPDPVEVIVHKQMTTLTGTLDRMEIPHVWDDYGPGAHAWGYWANDLRETLPDIMATFADPPAAPKRVTFTAVEPTYSVYGWKVSFADRPLEFSTLQNAGRRGFALNGSGLATVTTPPRYRPGKRMTVTFAGMHGMQTTRVKAGPGGRLRLPIDLAPANAAQQDTPGATTAIRRVAVRIRR
jgi:S-formylglutathione hydrolase FrmB